MYLFIYVFLYPKFFTMKKIKRLFLIFILFIFETKIFSQNNNPTWWKEAIVYQIYPRSFKDSDGDGIGDLKGIISKLDYLKSLGITAVWINPIYSSPNEDNGYDVSDYRNISPEYGTMQDFDSLLSGLHKRGIKIIMDFVLNHSSSEHEWFKQSKSSRTNKYRNYYHWWNAEKGKPNYRYSLFDVNHDAWKYDSTTNAYYLHYFSPKQPDLNWENPTLRNEIYDILNFWAIKGIDGFRLDAFQFVCKDTNFPALPNGYEKNFPLYYAMQGNIHNYLKEMNQKVFSKYNVFSVAEGAGNNFIDAHNLVDENRQELNLAYAFDGVDIAKYGGYDLIHFKDVFTKWDSAFAKNGWLSIFLSNHDQARLVSRFGNDNPAFRNVSSKMLTTFILTMRGTPFYYYGDELGMTNPRFNDINDYKDIPTTNEYNYQKSIGTNMALFMEKMKFECRGNGRTPFQWNNTKNAGFSTGTPWINLNPNYISINQALQQNNINSTLNYFKKMIQLRKKHPILVYGDYQILDKNNPAIYAYIRTLNGKKWLILLNFTHKNATTFIPNLKKSNFKLIINNYVQSIIPYNLNYFSLKPYQSLIIEI